MNDTLFDGGLPGGAIAVPVTLPLDNDEPTGMDNPDYDPGLPVESAGEDERGMMERFADATGDTMDNDVGRIVTDSDGRPLTGAAADFALNDDRPDDTPDAV